MNDNKAYVMIICDENENVIETRVFSDVEDYHRAEEEYLSNGIREVCGSGACGCWCGIYKPYNVNKKE